MAKKKPVILDDHPIETFYPSEIVDIDSLKPWTTNYNTHPEDQLSFLRRSLADFGQVKNIVAWGDYIVAGHGLVEAARGRGWRRVEVKRLPPEWTEAQVEAVLIADNRLAQLSTPDDEALASMLQRVRQDNATLLDAVGYNNDEVDAMLRALVQEGEPGGDAEPQIDRAAELQAKWQVQPGDLWRIGQHRLICGDCTDLAVVSRLMDGEKADIAWFDPPFGINLKPQRQKTRVIENDGRDEAQALWQAFLPILKNYMNPDTHLFLCQGWSEFDWTLPLVRQHFTIKSKVVWNKNVWGIGYYTRPKHEDILYCWNGKPSTIDDPVADVWDIARENAPTHAAEKPPDLSAIAIKHFSEKGAIVADWFNGVGGSIIACQNLNRRCRAVEISPNYCAVILQRMADAFPGIEIERIADAATVALDY